ncbi:protein phosphatase 1, regulatory subunit 3Ca [Pangasianodon hypophthalmus]|uniref:protein phosphatase 1, regulatory subunit 3Ca n=1 Tax=Pangasianodon hypophthalmus TaxID=310915 RepID=UPI002306F7D2|nr:protein phosphatase 1, regulatory subunit 3Ca [Pangasianodon hypophthalmus]
MSCVCRVCTVEGGEVTGYIQTLYTHTHTHTHTRVFKVCNAPVCSVLKIFDASILHNLEPINLRLIMPVDMAVQLYITHSPPLHSFLSSYEDYRARNLINVRCKPLRPCINTKNTRNTSPNPPCRAWSAPETKAKKKVVFADSKGMSLTAVHVFSLCENNKKSDSLPQFHAPKIEGALNPVQTRILEFRQPAAEYLDFRNRLMKNLVCLESCTLQGHTLTGTIKVRNLSFEKSVHIRITFDSWKNHRDVECTFMNDVCGHRDTDTFSFVIEIPACVPPQDSVEFCISYTSGGKTHWDNNNGKNYALVTKHDDKTDKSKETDLFDRFRSQQKCNRFSERNSWMFGMSAPYW